MGAQQNKDVPHILIFSVYKHDRPEWANKDAHDCIKQHFQFNNIGFKELEGCYAGHKELSFLVRAEQREKVEELCKQFDQGCYLESFNDRTTELVYPNGRRENIGVLKCIPKTEAKDNYTYDIKYDRYYKAVKV